MLTGPEEATVQNDLERLAYRLRWLLIPWIVGVWSSFVYHAAGDKGAAFVEQVLSWFR
jgi:uncharacterized membrane protein YqhA